MKSVVFYQHSAPPSGENGIDCVLSTWEFLSQDLLSHSLFARLISLFSRLILRSGRWCPLYWLNNYNRIEFGVNQKHMTIYQRRLPTHDGDDIH